MDIATAATQLDQAPHGTRTGSPAAQVIRLLDQLHMTDLHGLSARERRKLTSLLHHWLMLLDPAPADRANGG